jgi:MFS family permease
VSLTVLFSTFWLVPVALVLLSAWGVSFVASSVEGTGVRASLRRSQELTRTRRTKSAMLVLVLLLLASTSGPVVGGLLLLVTGWPVATVNAIAALVTALLVPVPTIGIGLLFYDLRHEESAQLPGPRPLGPPAPQRLAGRLERGRG